MHIVLVNIHVKPEFIEAFKTATLDNAQNSLNEPGIARFDFLQDSEDPTRFALFEVYRSQEDVTHHKATEHYLRWQKTVLDLMAEPRTRSIYDNIFPDDSDW